MKKFFSQFAMMSLILLYTNGLVCYYLTPFLVVAMVPLCFLLAGPWHHH